MDKFENKIAQEGVDRCFCGCKYWENDHCVDCGESITFVREGRAIEASLERSNEFFKNNPRIEATD
jgi:hypothetical protein